ncbi:hypothetical protein IT072_07110 [Leifsonia sp. ZF2019]|uniref:DoxX family protein n=1 Tax=Leifsonia sp. ZF2019 TaxID=2781978 RepID=UPI001CBE7F91|nr:hypothetical protein [Leifsonia sp. ZF2019]UAJ80773.1 hypothetical protein IT072_07110 [Leifsonia sp. ZF2019]
MTRRSPARTAVRLLLGAGLVFAGVSHLTFAREDFRAQVPDFVPLDEDTTVLASGVVEIALGTALALTPQREGLASRSTVGWAAAAFFAAVFPGNVSQWQHRRSAFGLDTDRKRLIRLWFQPVLIAAALYGTNDRR